MPLFTEALTPAIGGMELLDGWRRRQGGLLDAAFRRTERPYRIVFRCPQARLRAYGGGRRSRPAIVIVPAPIKRGYIWDLAPGASVVERCRAAGFGVYMLEWTELEPGAPDGGLADYADRLIRACLETIGKPAILAGHSLGGTLAAIFAALNPDWVRGLVLLESPLAFGSGSGTLTTLVRRAPPVRLAGLRRIPGTLLDLLSASASPEEFVFWRARDRMASLGDARALRTHLLVERWSLDEFPMPARLFEDVVETLYRENRFAEGRLCVGGRTASARNVAAPLIGVVDPQSDIVPTAAMRPFFEAARSSAKALLEYTGEPGVALRHTGILVGRNAHRVVWPAILDWARRR